MGKDAARIWINDNIKMQNFSHSLVSIIILILGICCQMCWYFKGTVGLYLNWVSHFANLCLKKLPGMKEEEEPEEEEEDELGHAETYAEYMPMKCKCDCCIGFTLL